MKTFKICLLAMLCLSHVVSCKKKEEVTDVPLTDIKTTQKYDRIKEFAWLEGTWENATPEGTFTEIWKKADDSTFTAISVFVKAKDTLFHETVVLDQKGDSLHYIVTTKNQNDEKPVSFTLKSFTAKSYVFENKQHDFPQKITYTRVTNDSLVAEISGTKNNKPGLEQFPMKRKQ